MADICTSLPVGLKRNDPAKYGSFGVIYANMLALKKVLSEHKHPVSYVEHSNVVSIDGTDHDKYHRYFKSKTRATKPSSTKREAREAINMVEVAFRFQFVLWPYIG